MNRTRLALGDKSGGCPVRDRFSTETHSQRRQSTRETIDLFNSNKRAVSARVTFFSNNCTIANFVAAERFLHFGLLSQFTS